MLLKSSSQRSNESIKLFYDLGRFVHQRVSFVALSENTDALSPIPSATLQRRHSITESSVSEGIVLRRVASLTLGRSTKKKTLKNVVPSKMIRCKECEGKEGKSRTKTRKTWTPQSS